MNVFGESAHRKGTQKEILPLFLIGGIWGASVIYHFLTDDTSALVPWKVFKPFMDGRAGWDVTAAAISLAVVIVGGVLAVSGVSVARHHGEARFARFGEFRKFGLFKKSGVVLGRAYNKPVIYDDDRSALVVFPPGEGKTTGVIIPTLLSYPGSVIVTDIKGEIGEATAAHRARFSKTYCIRFDGKPTHRINPLDFIRDGVFRTRDIDNLASKFFPPSDEYFKNAPRSLFVALLETLFHMPDVPHTLRSVWLMLNPTVRCVNDAGEEVIPQEDVSVHQHYLAYLANNVDGLPEDTQRALMRFSNLAKKQLDGVVDGLNDALQYWRDPLIDQATSASDFDVGDLRREPHSIYFQFSMPEYKRFSPLIRILYEFIFDSLMETEPGPDEPYRVLAAMDEFANMGKLNDFTKTATLSRGYGLQLLAVCQGLSQPAEVYGREASETLFAAFKIKLFSVANDAVTARFISDRPGTRTTQTQSRSRKMFGSQSDTNISTGHTSEKLVKDYDPYLLEKGRLMLFVEGMPPGSVKTIRYWKWKFFNSKVEYSKQHYASVQAAGADVVDYSGFTNYPCDIVVKGLSTAERGALKQLDDGFFDDLAS